MEDGLVLRRYYNRGLDARHRVLILVVMEDVLVLNNKHSNVPEAGKS